MHSPEVPEIMKTQTETRVAETSSAPQIAGSISSYPRVPAKFDVPFEREEGFLDGCKSVISIVSKEGGISNRKTPDSLIVAAFEASSGSLCPGFLGNRRPFLEERLNRLFGKGGWETQHIIAGRISVPAAGLKLYEEGYVHFLRQNPKILNWLCTNYSDVFDTAPSNIESRFDYTIQEAPHLGRHLHDIAIRHAVHLLGRQFSGDRLLHVRGRESEGGGKNPEGYNLSPGEVPFHRPQLIPNEEVPNNKPWWKAGSIEDFYQRTRRIVVPEFDDSNAATEHVALSEERKETFSTRIASRFLLRLLPSLQSEKVSLDQLNDLPWMVDKNSFALDRNGLPRPFTREEMTLAVKALHEQLQYFFRKGGDGSAKMTESPWLGFDHSQNFLAALDKWQKNIDLDLSEKREFPDFAEIKSWENALPHFWKHIHEEGKRPLFLARDAWVIMEYLGYRGDLIGEDRQHYKRSIYIPGTPPRPSLKKNVRSLCEAIESMVEQLGNFARDAYDATQEKDKPAAIRAQYIKKVNDWLSENLSASNSIWFGICEQIIEQFPANLQNLIVVDSDGTGKTAQFIATMLEHFAKKHDPQANVEVLLGGMKETPLAPAIGVPNLAEIHKLPIDSSSGRHLPDTRWPFNFAEYNPGPHFNVEKHPCRYLILLWRSMQLYNLAVENTYPEMISSPS